MGSMGYEHPLLQELEIKSLLCRERYYRDTAQWQKLRDCYHPDAGNTRVEISWYGSLVVFLLLSELILVLDRCNGDIDAFVDGSRKMTEKGSRAVHNISPVEVSIQGYKALGESVGCIQQRLVVEGTEYEMNTVLRFVSRLQRTEVGWKMLTFEAIYDYDSIKPLLPTEPGALQIPPAERSSYRCMSWLLSEKGYTVSQTLPGMDRPDLVEEFMKGHLEWLSL